MQNNEEEKNVSIMKNKIRLLVEVIYVIASLITISTFWHYMQNYKAQNKELNKFRKNVLSNQQELKEEQSFLREKIIYLIPLAEQAASQDEKQKIEKIKAHLQQKSNLSQQTDPDSFSNLCRPTIFSGCNELPCHLTEQEIGVEIKNFQWGAIRNEDGWVSIFQKRNNSIVIESKFHESTNISADYLNQDQREEDGQGIFYKVNDGVWLFKCTY